MTQLPPSVPAPAPADTAALELQAAQTAQALAAIRGGEVDALFVAGAGPGEGGNGSSGWMFTLDGADRAYRLLIEEMAEGALTLSPAGQVIYANRRFADMLGRPLQHVIGAPIAEGFAPEARDALRGLLAPGQPHQRSAELDLLGGAGERLPVFVSVNPLLADGPGGVPSGTLGLVVTDLTWQKRSEAQTAAREQLLAVIEGQRQTEASLRESLAAQRLLQACVANLNDIVIVTEAEPFGEPAPRIVFVNEAFTRHTGYTSAEVLGRSPRFLHGPNTDRAELARIDAAMKRREPVRAELVHYAKDGSTFWTEMQIAPVADAAGSVMHWVAIVRDIGERKRAELTRLSLETQVREAQKMEAIGTLAGGIAHDFNNILGAILGNVALAKLDVPDGHPARPRLMQIAVSGARARSLVEQILTFSRHEPVALNAVALSAIVDETAEMLRATLPATVKLSVRMADGPLRVRGDATQLQQVVLNLCTNAWHALPQGTGAIEVRLAALQVDAAAAGARPARTSLDGGSYVHLSVSDSGVGMGTAVRARIFEPFFTTKPAGQGTGLGLSVVHGIVASHGGTITVSSRPGYGSRFDLYFPRLDDGLAPAAAPSLPLPLAQGCGEHVLYVDDDAVMLTMVEHLLHSLGYRATCIADPCAALAAVRAGAEGFDIVVTDFNMPQLSGIELALALRDIDDRLPVVISSGYLSERLRSDAEAAGVVALMRKENTLDDLAGVVERALAGR